MKSGNKKTKRLSHFHNHYILIPNLKPAHLYSMVCVLKDFCLHQYETQHFNAIIPYCLCVSMRLTPWGWL